MNVLVVCSQGQNRSKYLAEYLSTKGCVSSYGGVSPDAINPLSQEQITNAEVIIVVRQHIRETLLERFDTQNKPIITLEVLDDPKRFSKKAQAQAKESWISFQEEYVYSELRRQVQEPLKKLQQSKK